MSGKTVAVSQFVDNLRSLEDAPITRDRMLEFMLETRVDRKSLDPYVHFRPDMYTRNLVYRDDQIELMAVCWQPGQRTVIHTHNGQLGWMGVEQGALAVVNYKWLGCNAADNQNVAGLDCLGGATELDLDRLEVQECFPGGPGEHRGQGADHPPGRRAGARSPWSRCTSTAAPSTPASPSTSRSACATAGS